MIFDDGIDVNLRDLAKIHLHINKSFKGSHTGKGLVVTSAMCKLDNILDKELLL